MRTNVSESVVSWEGEIYRILKRILTPGKIAIAVGIGTLDTAVLYVGTMTTWAFVHRWVLMAVGIVSGMVWMAAWDWEDPHAPSASKVTA